MSGADENITVVGHTSPAPYQQYLRSISLTVGQSASELAANQVAAVERNYVSPVTGLSYDYTKAPTSRDLSQLRVVFSIVAATASTPRQLNLRVFNVARATAATIEQEFDTVSLSAGYQGHNGLLFSGTIQQKRYGRETATDTFLDIFASDGYDVLANAFISQTLATGWTYADVYREIISVGAPYGLKASSVLPPAYPAGIRPLVMFGTLRKVMDGLSINLGLRWSVENNVLTFVLPSVADQQIVPPTMSLVNSNATTATVLSPSTGLIGIPIQTLDGIEATCLLNSAIKPGGLIKIDSSLIVAGKNDLAVSVVNPYPRLASDGVYRVMWTEHEGDTRGQPWYTHLVAEALTGAGTIQQSAIEKAGFAGGL